MLDISKFVTVGDDGKAVIDTDAYQSAYDAELRKSLDTNSENTRKKLETEIRKQLEEEAKLSAEEKLKKDREEFEASMAEKIKSFAQKQARTLMKGAEFADEEIDSYLELVSDEDSLSKITKIIDVRKKQNEALKQKWQEELSENQPNPQSNNSPAVDSLGKQMALKYQNKSDSNEPKVTAFGTN